MNSRNEPTTTQRYTRALVAASAAAHAARRISTVQPASLWAHRPVTWLASATPVLHGASRGTARPVA